MFHTTLVPPNLFQSCANTSELLGRISTSELDPISTSELDFVLLGMCACMYPCVPNPFALFSQVLFCAFVYVRM